MQVVAMPNIASGPHRSYRSSFSECIFFFSTFHFLHRRRSQPPLHSFHYARLVSCRRSETANFRYGWRICRMWFDSLFTYKQVHPWFLHLAKIFEITKKKAAEDKSKPLHGKFFSRKGPGWSFHHSQLWQFRATSQSSNEHTNFERMVVYGEIIHKHTKEDHTFWTR